MGGKRAKSSVFRGTKAKTSGGLTKDKLTKNKAGKVVSKARSAASKKMYAKGIGLWNKAVMTARKELGIKGFQAVGGKCTGQGFVCQGQVSVQCLNGASCCCRVV